MFACASDNIYKMEKYMDAIVKLTGDKIGEEKDQFLIEQQKWLNETNQECIANLNLNSREGRWAEKVCISNKYLERVDIIKQHYW